MIYLRLGREGDELALTWHPDHEDTMILLSEDLESLEIAVGPGYPIEEFEKGWQGGGFYFFGAMLHPTQAVQRFAHWIPKFCPAPSWAKGDLPTKAEFAETLRKLQE